MGRIGYDRCVRTIPQRVLRDRTSEVLRQVGPDGTTATLTDLYLVPGVHWFGVRVDGPEYALAATTLGPPDPDGEREPNGDRVLAASHLGIEHAQVKAPGIVAGIQIQGAFVIFFRQVLVAQVVVKIGQGEIRSRIV